jgi:hypothetical protein
VGPTLRHGVRIPVDPEERRVRRGVEDASGVSSRADRAVEQNSPIPQSGHEQIDDLLDEDGGVFHMSI